MKPKIGPYPYLFKKTFPSNALFLKRATFVNAVKRCVGLAGSEKGRIFASAIGNNGAAARRAGGNESDALYIAA